MDHSFIEQVRSFNRAVTLRTGALNDSYLGRGRPLGQARVLFEIGPEGSDLSSLRERLGLDSGYTSRLLRALEADGLVIMQPDDKDGRRRRLILTEKGLGEHTAYDMLSDRLAQSLLDTLSVSQCARLVGAMAEIERLVKAASVTITAEPEDSADAQRCVSAYFNELHERFEGGFDPGNSGYAGKPQAKGAGTFLIARLDGCAIGCGAMKAFDASTGEIKRMWIAPEARGMGVARRLLEALEHEAMRAGFTRILLDTNRSLGEAQALYRKSGYRETEPYNENSYADFWFEKRLV